MEELARTGSEGGLHRGGEAGEVIEGEATFDERLDPGLAEPILCQQREAPLLRRNVDASEGADQAEAVGAEQGVHLDPEVRGQIYLDGGTDCEVRAFGDRGDSGGGGALYYVLKGGTSEETHGKRLGADEEGQGQGPHDT